MNLTKYHVISPLIRDVFRSKLSTNRPVTSSVYGSIPSTCRVFKSCSPQLQSTRSEKLTARAVDSFNWFLILSRFFWVHFLSETPTVFFWFRSSIFIRFKLELASSKQDDCPLKQNHSRSQTVLATTAKTNLCRLRIVMVYSTVDW